MQIFADSIATGLLQPKNAPSAQDLLVSEKRKAEKFAAIEPQDAAKDSPPDVQGS